MKKLFAAIKRAPKRAASLAIVVAAVLVPAGLLAWGPDRPTYTYANPSDHVTFNSITDNPTHGDERNFVQVRAVDGGSFGEQVAIQPGKEYEVYAYYHNNAKTYLNSAEQNYKGIASNAQMRIQMPAVAKAGEPARITGFVSADNATPKEVWDEAYGTSATNVSLRYVQDSATIHSNGVVNGQKLPASLLTTGTQLGYDSLNGKLPGCNEFAGYVTFRFKAVQPGFEVAKTVGHKDQNDFTKSITAQPNEEIEYKIAYTNTGGTRQDNVMVKDTLPAGVSYIPGSTKMLNSTTGNAYVATNDGVTAGGINIGSYNPGGNAYVKFRAKVTDNAQLQDCGLNTLRNRADVHTNDGSRHDTADVVVSKTCENPVKYVCDSLTVAKIERTKFNFTTVTTEQNAVFKKVEYIIRNEQGTEVERKESTAKTLEYVQTVVGKYTVQAVVTFTVNGEEKTATSDNCKKPFEVEAPEVKEIEVCDLTTKTVITIKEEDFDSTKHSKDLNDCKEVPVTIEVCELATKKVITIKESEFDSSKHSKNLADCKETPVEYCPYPGKQHLPKNSPECIETPKEMCPYPGKGHLPKDSTDCAAPAAELPQTGFGGGASLVGLGLFTAGLGYALSSRRIREMLIG
jgi:uncharacterized repeat protein (TIGR01451 family)